MKIPVKFADLRSGVVRSEDLQELIQTRKIMSFHRNDEWVKIGVDPIRGIGGKYRGPERRGDVLFY